MSVSSLYKYYEGGIHKVITTGINTENNLFMIVHEDEERQTFITPSDTFNGFVEVDGELVERYKFVGIDE